MWNQLRRLPDAGWAKARPGRPVGALLKNPATSPTPRNRNSPPSDAPGGATWRAYEMKETFRAIFAGDLDQAGAAEASTSGAPGRNAPQLEPFVRSRPHHAPADLILNAVEHGISNGAPKASTPRSAHDAARLRVPAEAASPSPCCRAG